jgi:uncharacterized MAPEG superfamily protein
MAANLLDMTRNFVSDPVPCPPVSLHHAVQQTPSITNHPFNHTQLTHHPIQSFYTIPAAWVLCIAPHAYATALGGKKFDIKNPRTYTSTLKDDQTIDNATKEKIVRAEGAQQNGFENIGFFAAAVVAGNIAGLSNSTLNYLTTGYLASRAAYVYIYINNKSDASGTFGKIKF